MRSHPEQETDETDMGTAIAYTCAEGVNGELAAPCNHP